MVKSVRNRLNIIKPVYVCVWDHTLVRWERPPSEVDIENIEISCYNTCDDYVWCYYSCTQRLFIASLLVPIDQQHHCSRDNLIFTSQQWQIILRIRLLLTEDCSVHLEDHPQRLEAVEDHPVRVMRKESDWQMRVMMTWLIVMMTEWTQSRET